PCLLPRRCLAWRRRAGALSRSGSSSPESSIPPACRRPASAAACRSHRSIPSIRPGPRVRAWQSSGSILNSLHYFAVGPRAQALERDPHGSETPVGVVALDATEEPYGAVAKQEVRATGVPTREVVQPTVRVGRRIVEVTVCQHQRRGGR